MSNYHDCEDGLHKAEPASTGEPPPKCTKCGGNLTASPTVHCPKCASTNFLIPAARPSEPSAPQTSVEPVVLCDICGIQSGIEHGHAGHTFKPPKEVAEQSAEAKKQCGCAHGDSDPYCPDPLCPNYIAAYHVKPAAPQPVAGEGPLTTDELLVILMEECAEVIQAASKCLRFGFTRNHPSYGDNDKVLAKELGDLFGIVQALPLDGEILQEYRDSKLKRAQKAKAQYVR